MNHLPHLPFVQFNGLHFDAVMKAGVDFVTKKKDYGNELHPNHKRDQHTNRPIDFIIGPKIGDVKRKTV